MFVLDFNWYERIKIIYIDVSEEVFEFNLFMV